MLGCAGEGEYVPFAADCSCDGPVEVWLQNVVDAMRAALSAEFKVRPQCCLFINIWEYICQTQQASSSAARSACRIACM